MSSQPTASAASTTSASSALPDHEFRLNHLKNYVGVPLAVAADGLTGALVGQHLVGAAGAAKMGALALDLIAQPEQLTPVGQRVVAVAETECGGVETALEAFARLRGSSTRFIDARPEFRRTSQEIMFNYGPVPLIVRVLSEQGALSLPALVLAVAEHDPTIAIEVFLRDEPPALDRSTLANASVYSGTATYQLKTLLFHAGIVDERGSDTSALVPTDDEWALDLNAFPRPGVVTDVS